MSLLETLRVSGGPFQRLPESFDVTALSEQALALGLGPTRPQVCVTSRPGCSDPLSDGRGQLNGNERDFTHFNDYFTGTYVEEVYKALPFPVGRVRFMWMGPRSCYSFHRDSEPRLHIALVTNPDALLLVQSSTNTYRSQHIPADGSLWWVDTRRTHTAANGSAQARIHLVASILQP